MEERFEQYIVKFERDYKNDTEKQFRFNIFKITMEYCDSYNAGNHSMTLGPTQFSDRTKEETKYLFYRVPREEYIGNTHVKSFPYENLTDDVNEIDWRLHGAATSVKNQGNCGSSWAFAAVAATEGLYKIVKDDMFPLSTQQLIDCIHNKFLNCKGNRRDNAFKYILEAGIAAEDDYPYRGSAGVCNKDLAELSSYTIDDIEYLPYIKAPYDRNWNELNLKKAVSMQPVTISMAISNNDNNFRNYHGGIYNEPCGIMKTTFVELHAMTIVGFGSDKLEGDYWLVKNSWGIDWGDKGYIKIKRNIGNIEGLCGIAKEAIYPFLDEDY